MNFQEMSVCEEQNFERIHKGNGKNLRNFLYYKCGDLGMAEDLMQESFVKLWENCGKIVYENARSFLYTVAGRLFIDKVRHRKVELTFMKEKPAYRNDQDPSYIMQEKEFKTLLEKAISDLPENQREVFLMNRIDKLTYEEIAEILGLSVKAIEKRMHNALQSLREKVSELKDYKI